MHSADYAVAKCLSVTRRYCVLTITHILKVFSPSGSPTILVFPYQTVCQYSNGNTPNGPSNARGMKQELSYRKQIARQLCTQFVDGIHRPKYYTVTLKSRLRVTQDHWKRKHWTDHTRLTISRVI